MATVKQTRKKRGPAYGEPGPGRPSGSKNRASRQSLEALRDRGIDPLETLADALATAQKEGDRPTVVDIASRLMPYCYPKLKATEVDFAEGTTIVWEPKF